MSKTSKIVTKTLAGVLSLAMVVTSLSVTGTTADAKAKIKSVKVASPVVNGGKLVLKKGQKKQIKVKVTASGKISKKVTYKSSNPKVAKIVKSKGKVYVKAVGKTNKTAKITIASKANKKKKTTLKIKIGTPIKSVKPSKFVVTTSVTNTKEADATKRTKKTKKTTKFVSTKKSVLTMTVKYDDKAAATTNQQTAQLYVKYSPTKVGYKGIKWKAKNSKIVYVSPYGVVTPVKAGSTKIYGYTKDGTNKKVTINVKINAKPATATPTPNYEPADSRTKTVVEDFESYPVGYNWESGDKKGTAGKATKGKEFVNSNVGKMTVVTDPENANNKCLKIEYTGNTQAYDYAPIFNLKMKKKLDEYSGIMFESRIVASNTGDCKYKTAYAYFAKYGSITPEYYFATSLTKADAQKKGISEELIKFSADSSHASGKDENFTVTNKGDEFEGMVYNNHSLPMMYDDWAKEKKKENRTIGFKESEKDTYKAGWHPNKLNLQKGNITDTSLLNQKNVSLVLGSTYTGKYPSTNASLTLYIDNVSVLSGETPCTAVNIENAPSKLVKGMKMSISADNFTYTPDNTTQTQLTWTSSDENVLKIDSSKTDPVLEAVSAGKVTVTAAVAKNPAVKTSFTVDVVEGKQEASDFTIDLSTLKIMPTKADDDKTTKVFSTIDKFKQANGVLSLEFTQANKDMYVLDLGKAYDLSNYKGFSLVGKATEQMSIELYPDSTDFQQDKYWTKQVQVATYPFFEGSHAIRSYEGTSYGDVGVEEDFWINWIDGVDSKGTKVEGTSPKGNLTNVRYVVLKANKFDTNKDPHTYELKSLVFKKDWRENTNPTDKEIKADPSKYPEYK